MKSALTFITAAAALFAVSALDGSVASAYQIKESSRGAPLRWSDGVVTIDVTVDEAPDGIDPQHARAAVRGAFATWNDALPEFVQFAVEEHDGPAPDPDTTDRINTVRWVTEGWDDLYDPEALAVTLTTYDADTGTITDADIVINANRYRWAVMESGCGGSSYDLQNILTHEVGHLLGLAHEKAHREATMYPSSGSCETKKRDLDADDLEGLDYLYTVLGPAPPAELPSFGCQARVAPGGGARAAGAAMLLALAFGGSVLRSGRRRFARR